MGDFLRSHHEGYELIAVGHRIVHGGDVYPSAGVSERSSSVSIGKRNRSSNASLRGGDKDTTVCMTLLNIAAVPNIVHRQSSIQTMAGSDLEFAFLQYDPNHARKRVHGSFQPSRQTCLASDDNSGTGSNDVIDKRAC